jgi:hypothetical protein
MAIMAQHDATADLTKARTQLHFNPAAFRDALARVAALGDAVDTVYPAHGPTPLTFADLLAIRDAYEKVWAGREPEREGELFGYSLAIHDFDRFAFLLPRGDAPLTSAR